MQKEKSQDDLKGIISEIEGKQLQLDKEFEIIKRKYYQESLELRTAKEELVGKLLDQAKSDFIKEKHFDGYDKIQVRDLCKMSFDQLEYLVFKQTGQLGHFSTKFYYYVGTEVLKEIARSREDTMKAMIDYLSSEHQMSYFSKSMGPCRYCRSVIHSKDTCPILIAMKCTACGQSGHTISHCNVKVKDLHKRRII